MKLLAVSGGVDSMLLAHKYRNKNVILAYVNYNVRKDTHIDQKIVEEFAKKNQLKLEKLILKKSVKPNRNFENWAREIRYDFFKKIYQKYNCSQLLIAHHKDDFLETCLMQKEKNKDKLFYGIKKKTTFKNMKINRPFLFKYWKTEIYDLAKKMNIQYHDDYTNFDSKYKRNEIRNNYLNNLSIDKKEKELHEFLELNNKNKSKIAEIKNEYKKWRKTFFNTRTFISLSFKDELIKLFINRRSTNVNLSKNIISNIILFIKSRNNRKQFKLSKNVFLIKKNNKLFLDK
ncbi:tRNA lysidine(34) synthetase TilS [Mesomycoplasma moatsii]|uniref:tRNA lysidine(34) synthetase TilS n=1 Tax=Mesomycoplasma moatsii TaxID=171287 RepID=UPI0003B6746B